MCLLRIEKIKRMNLLAALLHSWGIFGEEPAYVPCKTRKTTMERLLRHIFHNVCRWVTNHYYPQRTKLSLDSIPCPQLAGLSAPCPPHYRVPKVGCRVVPQKLPQFGTAGRSSRLASWMAKYMNAEKFKSQHRWAYIHPQTARRFTEVLLAERNSSSTQQPRSAELCSRCQMFSCHFELHFGTRWSKYSAKVRFQAFARLCRHAIGYSFSGPSAPPACPIRAESDRRKPVWQ